jgi:hypothetical protein
LMPTLKLFQQVAEPLLSWRPNEMQDSSLQHIFHKLMLLGL